MISDVNLRLSGTSTGGQAVNTSTNNAVYYSTDNIDLQSATNPSGGTTTTQVRDLGAGEDLYLVITVGTAITGVTSLTPAVIVGTTATGGSGTEVVVASLPAIPVASLTAGKQFYLRINPFSNIVGSTGRYLYARYTHVGTGSAGTLFADIVTDIPDSLRFYGSGFTVT